MDLFEVKAEIPIAMAGAADDALLEGLWGSWSVVEDIVAKRAWVVGIFPNGDEARVQWDIVAGLLATAGIALVGEPTRRELRDTDWRDSYKAHFHAWQFDRLHWVPVWERGKFQLPPGDVVLWLDPGLAFGTGNHETTRLCCERLVALATGSGVWSPEFGVTAAFNSKLRTPNSELHGRPARVLDVGCGSGILALSAALLGYREVSGFDNDPEAVRVSEENAALNGLAGRVKFYVGDFVSGLAGREAEVLLANVQADVLIRFARQLVDAVAPGGSLVLSGILSDENAGVREKFETLTPKWAITSRMMGEWSDVMLTRPG